MESHTNEKIRLLYSLQMINNYAQVSSGERERERERERGYLMDLISCVSSTHVWCLGNIYDTITKW